MGDDTFVFPRWQLGLAFSVGVGLLLACFAAGRWSVTIPEPGTAVVAPNDQRGQEASVETPAPEASATTTPPVESRLFRAKLSDLTAALPDDWQLVNPVFDRTTYAVDGVMVATGTVGGRIQDVMITTTYDELSQSPGADRFLDAVSRVAGTLHSPAMAEVASHWCASNVKVTRLNPVIVLLRRDGMEIRSHTIRLLGADWLVVLFSYDKTTAEDSVARAPGR